MITAMSANKPILARISPNCQTVPMYVAAHSEFRLGLRCRSPQVRLRGFTISTQTADPFFLANVSFPSKNYLNTSTSMTSPGSAIGLFLL